MKMSKAKRARKCAKIQGMLAAVERKIQSIQHSPQRKAGSQLVSALGIECRGRHTPNFSKIVEILSGQGFMETLAEGLEKNRSDGFTKVARNLQLHQAFPLRD